MTINIKESNIAPFKDDENKRLEAGPNNSITIDTLNLGIGDHEFAIDDQINPIRKVHYLNVRPEAYDFRKR